MTGQRLPSGESYQTLLSWSMLTFVRLDFLLRFSAATIDADTATLDLPKKISPTFLLPDGLLHPRFQALSGGSGWYILCWKDAVEEFGSRGTLLLPVPRLITLLILKFPIGQHKRVHPTAHFHSLLASQITDHLRLRVLQEMELLGNRIEALPRNVQSTHVRRLSLDEWMDMKEGRWVPESSTLAVLVVPKVRPPREMMSDDPGSNMSKSPKEVHPLCNLYQSAAPPPNAPLLPIYSGYALFPNRDQRTACRQALSRLITIERKRRWRGRVFPSAPKDGGGGRARASDAFLFKADLGTASRVDVVPLVIALWRLRLWEGEGWSK